MAFIYVLFHALILIFQWFEFIEINLSNKGHSIDLRIFLLVNLLSVV